MKATLQTRGGQLVTEIDMPEFPRAPDVVISGERIFVLAHDSGQVPATGPWYVEALAWWDDAFERRRPGAVVITDEGFAAMRAYERAGGGSA